MAITHDIEIKTGHYQQAYHAIVEIRVTDRWSNLQRQQPADQRPAKYSIQIFTDIWANEAARVAGEVPISRRVDRGAVEAGKDVWAEGYRILGDALLGKHPESERTKAVRKFEKTAHEFAKAPEHFREISHGGQTYRLVPVDALTLMGALARAVDGETSEIRLFSGETLTLTHEDISAIGRQLAGEAADEVSGQDRGTGSQG